MKLEFFLILFFVTIGSCFVKGKIEPGNNGTRPFVAMTEKERGILQQFKQMVLPKVPVTSLIYSISRNDDLFLLNWLRHNRLNLKDSERQFLNHLRWRDEENMDGITFEDWTRFQNEYPAFVDSFDKSGRPTAEIWFTDWDIRRAVLSGQGRRLSRWVTYQFEENMRRLYRTRSEGKHNVTQAVLLTDAEGFSFRQSCPLCVQIFVRMGANWETYYPNLLQSAVGINVTPAFQMVLDGFRPFLRPETRTSLISYVRRDHWMPELNKQFDRSERSVRFGGTKER